MERREPAALHCPSPNKPRSEPGRQRKARLAFAGAGLWLAQSSHTPGEGAGGFRRRGPIGDPRSMIPVVDEALVSVGMDNSIDPRMACENVLVLG